MGWLWHGIYIYTNRPIAISCHRIREASSASVTLATRIRTEYGQHVYALSTYYKKSCTAWTHPHTHKDTHTLTWLPCWNAVVSLAKWFALQLAAVCIRKLNISMQEDNALLWLQNKFVFSLSLCVCISFSPNYFLGISQFVTIVNTWEFYQTWA